MKSITGIEPSYFLPLTTKSQSKIDLFLKNSNSSSILNEITHLFFKNSNLSSFQIPFDKFQNLIHLDLSRNNLTEFPEKIGFFNYYFLILFIFIFFLWNSKSFFFLKNRITCKLKTSQYLKQSNYCYPIRN